MYVHIYIEQYIHLLVAIQFYITYIQFYICYKFLKPIYKTLNGCDVCITSFDYNYTQNFIQTVFYYTAL